MNSFRGIVVAKIVLEFDTVTKLATASIDGKPVDNFTSADIYQRYGYDDDDEVVPGFSCSVRSSTEDETEKMTRTQVVYASQINTVQDDMKAFFAKQTSNLIQ